jgi:chorismate synthase
MPLRYFTAGESHGPSLTAIIEGLPSGLPVTADLINIDLKRRQMGYGRGGRMKIETDQVEITSGIRFGETLGSPVTLVVHNRDWANWTERMSITPLENYEAVKTITRPRPGHADYAGLLKYHRQDIRDILERASARETTMRVAVGSVAKALLNSLGIEIVGHIVSIGSINAAPLPAEATISEIRQKTDDSPFRCFDTSVEEEMKKAVDEAKLAGDTLGGIFEVIVDGLPVGLGTHTQWDRKLDGRLAQALMSIQAIKGVEIGMGFEAARKPGSQVHDPIYAENGKIYRKTNHAGGLEGSMTNGERLIVRAAMKPIATLMKALDSVDLKTRLAEKAVIERSDVCAAPAAAVIGEAVVAIEIAKVLQEKFGEDSLAEIKRNRQSYLDNLPYMP